MKSIGRFFTLIPLLVLVGTSAYAADSELYDQSSGKELDSRTEGTNGQHRPVVVIGDPSTNANVLAIDSAGAASVESTASYAEDTQHTSGDKGVPSLGLYLAFPGASTTTTNDYAMQYISSFGQYVDNVNHRITKDIAITVDTAAYAAGDYINDADDITDLTSVFRTNVYSGTITDVVVTDEGKEGKNLEVWFFDTDPTNSTFTDNAAFTVADADLVNVCCVASLTTHYAAADNGVSIAKNIGCNCVSAGTTLYAAIVAREAVTFDATDAVTLRVVIDQD